MAGSARLRVGTLAALVTAWALAVVPAAATALVPSGVLLGVSCSAADACVAVGTASSDDSRSRTLADRWDGTSWTVMPTPNPPGLLGSNFYGVSCSSASSCMAVGGTSIFHGSKPLAERWDGRAWKIVPTPRAPGGDTYLSEVSCSAANACVATGFAIFNNHNNAIAEAWNGKRWTLKTVPRPAGTTYSSLSDVSCASAHACVAVGSYQRDTSKDSTLAEIWNGSSWRIVRTPNPPSGVNGVGLSGVSCRSRSACVAVGGSGTSLIERFNGRTWSISPNAGGPSGPLADVSCGSPSACVAIGADGAGAGASAAWDGSTWAPTPMPGPPGAAYASIESVSCTVPKSCVAVGDYATDPRSTHQLPVAEVWNGTTWAFTTAP